MGNISSLGCWALFSFQKILQNFLDSPSYKIFRRIFLTINKFIQKIYLNIYLMILILYFKY
jgi:hypothetical protein